jgi:hypothetical protein
MEIHSRTLNEEMRLLLFCDKYNIMAFVLTKTTITTKDTVTFHPATNY